MCRITISLPDQLAAKLDQYVDEQQLRRLVTLSRSSVIQQALADFLVNEQLRSSSDE